MTTPGNIKKSPIPDRKVIKIRYIKFKLSFMRSKTFLWPVKKNSGYDNLTVVRLIKSYFGK